MAELAYSTKERVEVNRRTPMWGGEWTLPAVITPVPAAWTPATHAPGTQAPVTWDPVTSGPVTPGPFAAGSGAYAPGTQSPATEASALLYSGVRSLPSTSHLHGTAHLRPAVKVPVRLSLAGLGAVKGFVSVQVTISPVMRTTSDVSVSFSYVEVGTVSVSPALHRTGGMFTAVFDWAVEEGITQLEFVFGGHSYRGRNSDHRDFSVTTEVTFQEHGKQAPTVLATSDLISL